jgi:hypothetical protein
MNNYKVSGQVSIYLAFIISAILIVVITAVFAPMGVLFNTRAYQAGEMIMLQANDSIYLIQDTEVRDRINATISASLSASENNIDINADLFQYSWILVIGLIGLVLFLYTRKLVEFQGGFN